jgi:hypothetical protein
MEETTAWKASDGVVFPTQDACRCHELRLTMSSAIQDSTGVEFVCRYPQSIFDIMWDAGYRRADSDS